MRKIIPHALLAVLTLGAGAAALASFQSTRFSAARAALVAAPCIEQTTGQAIPTNSSPIEAIIPGDALGNAGLYATPATSGLIAVAPTGWICHAATSTPSGVDIRNSEDHLHPLSVLQFLSATGAKAEQVACPFSRDAEKKVFKIGGDALVKASCATSELNTVTRREGAYVFITAKSPDSGPLYGAVSYSAITDSANVGICIPSNSLTTGTPSYVFSADTCQQYLRAFARNNPMQ